MSVQNIANVDNLQELQKNSPWLEAEIIDWSCITSGLEPKKYNKNDVIFSQNSICEYVYLVKDGRIRLDIYSQSGDEKTLFIADRGTFIAELSPIDGLPNICCATAATDCTVFQIPKSRFQRELQDNNKFASNLLYLNAKKIRSLVEEIKQLSFNDSYYRVCNALIHLVLQYATHTGEGYKLNMKFTHQEMGSLTGISRVSVSNIISDLTSQGILKKENGYVVIKDINSILDYLVDKK